MNYSKCKYGNIAITAAKKAVAGSIDACSAWEGVANVVLAYSSTSARKSCPKQAFLGLVREGKVAGVPRDSGITLSENGKYALKALELLRQDASYALNAIKLWKKVVGDNKKHNAQMHVVIALWNEGFLVDVSES